MNALLNGPGPFTVFAPTDDAFLAVFTQEELDEMLADDADKMDDLDTLAAILMGHIVGGEFLTTSLTEGVGEMLTTLIGSEITATLSEGAITFNNATLVGGNIASGNGVIHVVDAVIE
jgi:uncharacterized surface protein with fasciclin (FAS1) repeats